jgi:hypothetical protein
MKGLFQVALGAALLLTAASNAQAQRGAHPIGPRSAGVIRHGTPLVIRLGGTSMRGSSTLSNGTNSTASNLIVAGGLSPLSLQDLLNPVPGFGFDFVHLAAANRDLGVRALIDPITQWRLAQAESLLRETPVSGAGFPFFMPSAPFVVIEQAPPQVVILQQPPTVIEQPAPAATAVHEASATPAPVPAPLPDRGEFVLVTRDGAQLLAVGFTRQGDRIVYVTQQGLRRSLLLVDLDPEATEQANNELGTSVRLPL